MPTTPLTQQSFQTVVSTNHIVLVDFWATWCGWCTRFAPVFEESSELHRDIVHATVEAEAEPALAAAAPSAPAPATAGRAGPAPGPQAYGRPGPRTA
ncbi:thioredoxin family protein [Nocardia sp. NPDC002869]|uniref:thioredoxin family protein n=1 Tax=Nocardia sp. NPDC002869 TaxID=3161032 RepID=UPI00398D681C